MKKISLRKLAESIENTMSCMSISPAELARLSGISYSSLMPILSGTRDFGVSKLIAIANALGCHADDLLDGLIDSTPRNNSLAQKQAKKNSPKYLVAFISLASMTYCMIYDVTTNDKQTISLPFSLGCGQNHDDFLDKIITSSQTILSKKIKIDISGKEIGIYASTQQYEATANREKIENGGNAYFSTFILESDAITNYKGIFGNKSGICITINDGSVITYSADNGHNIIKLQGYGFPISDTAGNEWIGCEALKHVINVKEGSEPSSLLSDKIFAMYNDSIVYLSECIMLKPEKVYLTVSTIAKELFLEDSISQKIVKNSAELLLKKIKQIDDKVKHKLPIALTGDLANLYKGFFPRERLMTLKDKPSTMLLNYGINVLKKATLSDE